MKPLRLLHQDAGPKALEFLRLYVFGIWLIGILLDPLPRLASLPLAYYKAVGILRLLPEPAEAWLLSVEGLIALKTALVMTCAVSLLPRAFRFASPLAVFFLLVYQCLVRGFGHVNHAEIMPLLAAVTLATFANLPRREPAPGYNPYAAPLITVALLLTLSYSALGFLRIYRGVSLFTGDTILNYVASRSLRSSFYDFNLGFVAVSCAPAAFLLKAGYPVVTCIEALAPLVMVSRSFRAVFLAVMVPFHILTLLLMEVSFIENLLLYIVLVDFSRFFERAPPMQWLKLSEGA